MAVRDESRSGVRDGLGEANILAGPTLERLGFGLSVTAGKQLDRAAPAA